MASRYREPLSQEEILWLLKLGYYRVDPDVGSVTGPSGKELTPVEGGWNRNSGYLFVRLYWNRKVKSVPVGRLVWMAVTARCVPPGFEIHHRDRDYRNNVWANLFCLHELDHRKLHNGSSLLTEEVPF